MEPPMVVAPPPVARPLRLHPFRGLRLARGSVGAVSVGRIFARPYRAVAARLAEWQDQGQIQHDERPALYLHEYTVGGITVRGLVGALDLAGAAGLHEQATAAVVPHEGVHAPQVAELAERMRETRMNPAPILLVHRGPALVRDLIAERIRTPPAWRFSDRAGQRHRIWRIEDAETIDLIVDALADAQVLIADGHHRYAAYLQLRDSHPDTPWSRGLAMLVDHDDTPLFLGAIHRLVHDVELEELLAHVESHPVLACNPLEAGTGLSALTPDTAVVTDGTRWVAISGIDDPRRPAVEVVHDQLIDRIRPEPRLSYHHSVKDALDAVQRTGGVAVLLPSTSLDTVTAASLRRLLPEKATSFQPKPSVGTLMRSLDDESAEDPVIDPVARRP